MNVICPCGSGNDYDSCCQPIINEERPALTAEELMRSRYTAFTIADVEYLMKTWACETRNLAEMEEIRNWSRSVKWVKLKITNTSFGKEDETSGYVTFQAFYREKGKLCHIFEESFFEKRAGSWIYVSGKHK